MSNCANAVVAELRQLHALDWKLQWYLGKARSRHGNADWRNRNVASNKGGKIVA